MVLFGHFPVNLPASPLMAFWRSLPGAGEAPRRQGCRMVPVLDVIQVRAEVLRDRPRPTLGGEVGFRLLGPARRLKDVAPERLLHAVYALWRAWPAGKGFVQSALSFEAPEAAVPVTALWYVLGGTPPERAIRQAWEEPLPKFRTPRQGRSAYRSGKVVFGPVAVPPEAAWVAGGILGQHWQSGAPLDGFRIAALPSGLARRWLRPIPPLGEGDENPARIGHRTWLPLMAVWAWWRVGADGIALDVVGVAMGLDGLDESAREDLDLVARAWPPQRKALFVPEPLLHHPGTLVGNLGVVALEVPQGVARSDLLAAIAYAARTIRSAPSAEEGVRAARAWLENLTPQSMRGLTVFRQLTV